MKRRWRRWQQRRVALGLVLYSLLLLLLVSYMLDYGARRRRRSAGEEEELLPPPPRRCPSLEEALGDWRWEEEQPLGHEAAVARNGTSAAVGREEEEEEEGHPRHGPGSRAGGRRHVYLHATWRTGSSFLGELFNQHPDVFYLYEPMWHLWQALYPGDALSLQGALRDMMRALFRCDFSVLRLYAPAHQAAHQQPPANLTTASLFGWRTNRVICSAPFCPAGRARHAPVAAVGLVDGTACERSCPPRALRDLEAECRKYPVVAIKDVRLLELGALLPLLRDPELDLRVVQLFRDPRAVHNSRLKAKQALLRESVQVLRSRRHTPGGGAGAPAARPPLWGLPGPGGPLAAVPHQARRGGAEFFLGGALEVICQAWLHDLVFARHAPPWLRARHTQVRYEDLVAQPRAQLRRLLRFAGLASLPALEDFALNMTRGDAYSPAERPFLLSARDARQALHAWRERLSRQQVRQVEAACGEAMRLLAYPLSGHDTVARAPPSAPPDPG